VNEKFVAVSAAQDTLASFHYQLAEVDSSVEAVGPHAAEQSSVCTGSEWCQNTTVHVSVNRTQFLPSPQMSPLKQHICGKIYTNEIHIKTSLAVTLLDIHCKHFMQIYSNRN